MTGHRRILSKVDNENPIQALRDEAKRQCGVEFVKENPPTYESQSNGVPENANQRVQSQFTTLGNAVETKIGEIIEESSPLIEWLVKLAADLINRFQVGEDGKTSFQRWKTKKFNEELPEFGEKVMFKAPDTKGKDKANVRWREGHYLGVFDKSNELLICLPDGVIKVRDVMRHASHE